MLDDLLPMEDRPRTLFVVHSSKASAVMLALDQINERFGKKAFVMAREGMK
jgi:DNA polymerase V